MVRSHETSDFEGLRANLIQLESQRAEANRSGSIALRPCLFGAQMPTPALRRKVSSMMKAFLLTIKAASRGAIFFSRTSFR